MENFDFIQLVIAFVIALALFTVLWKYFKLAIRTVIVVVLIVFGIYFALFVIDLKLPEVYDAIMRFFNSL